MQEQTTKMEEQRIRVQRKDEQRNRKQRKTRVIKKNVFPENN